MEDKIIYSDQFNIVWNVLDKRATMIVAFANFSMRRSIHNVADIENKSIVISCIYYLFDELKSLNNTKIRGIKENQAEHIISYDMANKLYFDSISSKNKWSDSDIRNMYNFVLEGCRESGIANPGFQRKDRASLKRTING
jgi:hypothetical protein